MKIFDPTRQTPYELTEQLRRMDIFYPSRHTGHYLASIYDWDIVLFVAGKMQEILNKGSDIPPRTMIIPRHEIFKFLRRHNVTKQQKDLEGSLSRLQLTGIETTIRNEGGFGHTGAV